MNIASLSGQTKQWLHQHWLIWVGGANLMIEMVSSIGGMRYARQATAYRFYRAAWQPFPAFVLITALTAVVIAQILISAASSYGLSHLAVKATVRVLMLELLPLFAALFVVMRSIPDAAYASKYGAAGSAHNITRHQVPFAVAHALAVWVLSIAGTAVVLVVTFFVMHGFNRWALPSFARSVSEMFNQLTALGILVKVAAFSLVIALAPAFVAPPTPRSAEQDEGTPLALVSRTILCLMVIEIASLLLIQW